MSNEDRPVLYLNVTIHDASEAVRDKVATKLESKRIPSRLKKMAASFAANMATQNMVAEKLAPLICKRLPNKMKEKGLTVQVEQVFLEGPFFVIELQVQHVDAIAVTESRTPDPLTGWVQWMFGKIGVHHKDALEGDYLPRLVQGRMVSIMGDILKEKFSERKLEATSTVLRESKQARYFFTTLKALRLAAEVSKKRPSTTLSEKSDESGQEAKTDSPSDLGAGKCSSTNVETSVAPSEQVKKKKNPLAGLRKSIKGRKERSP